MGKFILFIALVLIVSCGQKATVSKKAALFPEKLSAWNFYQGELSNLHPRDGIFSYHLSSALFTDYAEKARFVKLPEGEKMTVGEQGRVIFPEGSIIIKNFFYHHDARDPSLGKRVIETRLLVKKNADWKVATYIWNEAQDEALLEILGAKKEIAWLNEQGKAMQVNYIVPDNNDCKGCHLQKGEVMPIGPKLANLDRTIMAHGKEQNQLEFLTGEGYLNLATPTGHSTLAMVDWQDTDQPIHDRAMSYLDINCAHCHTPDGPASNTGLFLNYDQTDLFRLGVKKTPVSAAQGSGGFDYNIVPGDPDHSILLYRMNSVEAGVAMPETGRSMIHDEGVALINDWILALKDETGD